MSIVACGEDPVQLNIAGTAGPSGFLKGLWTSGCTVVPEATRATNFSRSIKRELSYTADLLVETTRLYSDLGCESRTATITRNFTYAVLSPTDQDDTIYNYQIQFQGGRINFTSGSFALKVNTDKLCGAGIFFESKEDTFVADQDCEIIDANPVLFPVVGDFLYDLVKIDKLDGQDRIRFGDPSTGDTKTEATRPTTILDFEQLRTSF